MQCPRCRQEMGAIGGELFVAQACASCGGTFYPEGELIKHLELVGRRAPAEPVALDAVGASGGAVGGAERPFLCPGCGARMPEQGHGPGVAVVLECGRCRGIWVQAGEFEHLARVLRLQQSLSGISDEVLDRYARALLEEDRERQRLRELAGFGQPKASLFALPCFTFMPVSDAEDVQRFLLGTWGLILVNVVLFVVGRSLFPQMAMVPAEVTKGLRLYTLVTHQFAHASIPHLILNMWFLRAFGDRVEDRIGPWRFVGVYVLLGVVAGLAQAFIEPASRVPCVGASGSISGIMGLYLVLFPTLMVRVVVWLRTVRVPAVLYLVVWFGMQVLLPAREGVAVEAHFGGFLAGAWVGGVLRILRVGAVSRRRRSVVVSRVDQS